MVRRGVWEGLLRNGSSGNPDAAATVREKFGGTGQYMQMLLPDDYKTAIDKAIAAPDFASKKKWTQEVMKLMIDKHCLQIMIHTQNDNVMTQKNVRDHGIMATPSSVQWTPEDAWLEKK